MNNPFAAQNVGGFTEIIADVRLLTNPIEIALYARCEIDFWGITSGANPLGVTCQVTHFTGTEFAVHLGRDRNPKGVGNLFGYCSNTYSGTAPDVYGQAVKLIIFGGEQIRARDIFNERKVPGLFAIFVKDWRQTVEETRAENGDDAGVGIEDRLTRAVGAGVAQCNRRDSDLFAPKQDQFFL